MKIKMSSKGSWVSAFLGVTAVALIAEVWAAFDGNNNTVPWTDLIVEYIPAEIFALVFGGLVLWLTVHFGYRYYLKHKRINWRAGARKQPKPPE